MDSGNGGGTGEDLSSALGVSILSSHGSHVSAPVLSNNSVQGDINISYNCSGADYSAPAAKSKPHTDAKSVILAYKESILPEYRTVQEYNSLAGQDVLLVDRYTQLLMVEKHRRQKDRVEEISARGETLHQVLTTRDSEAYQRISVDQFFSPMGNGEIPRAVLLQGHSGMGKTFTAQKIMHDWMSGTLFASTFDAVFHLKCKELNLCTQEKSLMELLKLESSFQPAMEEVLTKSPQRVLFLIDGFDELRFSLDIPRLLLPSDSFTRAPVETTLSALLQGHILSKSSLLVTSRSTASDRLSKLLKRPQRYTEILGFSEEGVQEYFQRFFKDEKLFSQAYNCVRSNESLFAACFVPIICWIVCTVLKEHFEEGTDDHMELTTTTSVFVHFVSTLLEHHCQGLGQPVPTLLRSLGQLAERGILEQQVLFEKMQVLETVSDPASVPFLCKFLLKKNVGKKTMFSFMHLSFQEFFTALFYATTDEEEGRRKVENLLQRVASGHHHLLPVIWFLFGLSNKELGSTLTETLVLSVSPTMHTQLEEWFLRFNSEIAENHNMVDEYSLSQERSIDIFNCLYERHEEVLARKAMELWESFRPYDIALSKTDCWVLRYCFQYCPEIRCLHLTDCNITAEKLRMLKPVLSRCKELRLQVVDLSDDDVEDLIPCLGEGKDLRQLHLGKSTNPWEDDPPAIARLIKSKLEDEGVRKILDSLYKQSSLGSLELEALSVTLSTVEVLFDLFQKKAFENSVSFEAVQLTDAEDAYLRVFLLKIQKDLWPEDSDCAILCYQISAECKLWCMGQEISEARRRLKGFLLRMSAETEMATINWRTFFHCCSADNQETGEHVDALMSCLSRMPGLEEVSIEVTLLDESWATGFLQLFLACPRLKHITCSVHTADKGSLDVCVENYKGMLRLSVKKRSLEPLSELEEAWVNARGRVHLPPACVTLILPPTCVVLILPPSPELQHLDWGGFFSSCLSPENNSDHLGPDENVEALLSFLRRVPDLKMVRLDMGPLTERSASGVISLIQACPTLTDLRWYCGEQGWFCGEQGYGTVSEEGLNILQQSQHHLRGILSLTGLKCRVSAELCPDHIDLKHRHQREELQFTGDSVQHRDVGFIHDLLNSSDDPFRMWW